MYNNIKNNKRSEIHKIWLREIRDLNKKLPLVHRWGESALLRAQFTRSSSNSTEGDCIKYRTPGE